jgi:two-component system OmpR family response regulator/two-component system copper resistance phosphate regulon response regulator CusR
MNVLVVEDEPLLGKSLNRGLGEAGHSCTWTKLGAKGLSLARTQQFDAIVLDLMLPDIDGLQVLKTLRDEGIRTPLMVLTALGSVDDRVRGLDHGADDYLVKPFAFSELLARLNALWRRAGARPAAQYEVGPLLLDLSTRKVTRSSKEIDLSPSEFSILELLMRNAGQIVSRKMLNEHLWGQDWDGMTNVLEVHINHLRQKIDRGFDAPLIQTVRGRGYALRAS